MSSLSEKLLTDLFSPLTSLNVHKNNSSQKIMATAGGWSTGSSACLTSLLLSHLSTPDEKAASTILKVFGMTRPGLEPTTFRL